MAIPGLNFNFDIYSLVAQFFWVFALIVFMSLAVACIAVLFYWLWHPIKMRYWDVYGTGDPANPFTIGRPRFTKFRRSKGAWVAIWPPFIRKNRVEPFDEKHFYSGNYVYAIKYKSAYVPISIGISTEAQGVSGTLNLVPQFMRNWQSIMHRENHADYDKESWWESNKILIFGVITVLVCLLACLVTVYLSYKFSTPSIEALKYAASVFENFGREVIS